MLVRSFRQLFARKNKPIVNSKTAATAAKPRKRPHLGLELLEDRVTPSTITQWDFSAAPAVNNTENGTTGNTVNQFAAGVEPTTGSGSLYTLGMYNNYNGGNSASDDILSTAGTADSGFSENTLRVRGASHNGWATHAAGAAEYTQGVEADTSTAGFTNVTFSFDWYSTTQGIRDLQVQYNTNVSNAGGWTNFVEPGGTGSNGISTSGTFLATSNDYWNATGTNGADPITVTFGSYANNDPNFGVRLVSAYDSTGNVPNDYASAALGTGGTTVIYNNNSGNWRFDNLTFAAGASATTSSALSASPVSPQNPGTSVTLTDTITPSGGSTNPAGSVNFYDGATLLGSATVTPGSGNTGVATLTVNTGGSPLALGGHTFSGVYTSTNGFTGSTTPNDPYTIGDPTSSVVTAGPSSPQQVGTNVTFTDVITPADIGGTSSPDGNPTGAVQFYDDGTAIGSSITVTPDGGDSNSTAQYSTSTLASGTHNITAVYTPTGNFLGSTSSALGYALYSGNPGPFTPGNLVILQAGDGVNQYNAQAPLFLNEVNATTGANVQQVAIPDTAGVGNASNQPITIDLSAAAGNGQLSRSYDGSSLTFDGIDSTINNGGLTPPATPTGSDNRVVAVVTGDPTVASDVNTTTDGPFYVGDDNRGSVAESPTGPIYTAGHPNQAGGAVSQGVHEFDTEGPSIGTQVSASTNIRGVTIGFDNRMYFSTASGLGGSAALDTAGIFTEAQALPTAANTPTVPANDVMVVPAIFGASKLGGVFLADMNGDGVIDNGDRLYFVDDGTVGGAGTGGLYVSTWNDGNTNNPWNTNGPGQGGNNAAAVAAGIIDHWSAPVRLGDAPIQTGSGGVGQLRGLTGTVLSPTEAVLYTTAYDGAANDSSYVQSWDDTNTGVSIANAQITSGTTVEITTLTPNGFTSGETVEVDGVGANNGAGAITSGYNGAWSITVIDSTHFTYSDTNSGASGLQPVNNQGAADVTVNGNIIQQLASGTDTIGGKTYGDVGLRGVAFAPVAATAVSLSQSPANPLTPGSQVTLTATLTNSEVTPTGQVAFIDQNTNTVLGFGTISTTGGVTTASLTLPMGVVGDHYVKAYFGGGGSLDLASANSNTIQVIEAGSTASTTSVASSLSAVAVAKQVTLTATVTSGATGTVSFFNGSVALANLLGNSTISGTTATLTTAFAAAGTDTIIAVYNGDDTYASSQGQTTVNVAPNATATITSSANNVALNATPTYTAAIVGNATLGTPAGTVTFTIVSATTNTSGVALVNQSSSAINLSAGPNDTATATWTSPALSAAGSYFVTVSYSADPAGSYSSFAVNTTSAANGVALIETVQQAFAPGDLVAVQRGDGTVNLGSSAYPVVLVEYKPSGGAEVQAVILPNADSGSTHALFLSGQNAAEGLLNRSANGAYLTLSGYDLPVGHTFITSTFPYQYPRTIAEIGLSGSVNTSTDIGVVNGTGVAAGISAASESGTTVTVTTASAHNFQVGQNVVIAGITPSGYDGPVVITGVPDATHFTYTAAAGLGSATLNSAVATPASVPYNPLDVVSYDGQEFWLASNLPVGDTTDSGIDYVGSVGATSAVQVGPAGGSAAAVSIAGGQLYVTKGSGNVQAVGAGLPTTPSQTLMGLPNLSNAYQAFFPNAESPEQVLLLNTNDGTTNNPNVAYIADQANGLLKFYLNSASISSLTESGTTVTVTLSAADAVFQTGDQVQISGASVAGYNGTFTITVVDGSHFTYTASTSGLANATGGAASEWVYGKNGTGVFGQKLVFAGGATGVVGYVVNPGPSAQVQLYVTGSNVQQQNPNQIDSLLDTNSPSQGFPSGSFSVLGFVGGASPSGSPNGNENFAGLAFVPGFATTTTLTASASPVVEGNNVTYTASVVSAGGDTPTGIVEFFDDGVLLGQGTLNSGGVATFTTTTPPALGLQTITAVYQSDVKDDMSTGSLALPVDFKAGNVIVSEVGTGSSLTSSATASSLDEFNSSTANQTTPVSVTALPTASAAATITAASWAAGGTATITTSAVDNFQVGQTVTIAGVAPSGYNGTFTITSVPTTTSFTYTLATDPGTYVSGGTATVPAALTEGGTTTTEGYLTDSADGHTLGIAGYDQAPGGSTSSATKTIGVVSPDGVVDTSTQAPSNTGSVRVAISATGLGFWVATSTGVRYVPFGNSSSTASTQVTPEVTSPTAVGIGTNNTSGTGSGTPGQLFASAGAGAQPDGVPALDSPFTVGDSLPSAGGNSIAVSPSFPTARDTAGNFPSTNQFAVSPDGNTIFIADSRTDGSGGVLEYFQSSANNWVLVGSLQLNSFAISSATESGTTVTITTSAANGFTTGQTVTIAGVSVAGYNQSSVTITVTGANTFTYTLASPGLGAGSGGLATSTDGGLRGLVADFSGASPVIYGTTTATSGNRIVKFTGGTLNGNNATFTATTLATAPTNEAFRGVALAPTAPGTTASTTTLTVSSGTGTYGTGVTLTATVTSGATGWVSFRNQATGVEIGAAQIVGNQAVFVTAGNLFASGTAYNIVAVYTGNATYAAGASSAHSVTINQATVGVTLTASANPVATGVNDTLSVVLTGVPAGTTPTGTVTFKDGSTTLGTGTLTQNIVNQGGFPVIDYVAMFTTAFTTQGTHSLSAVYSGDVNFATATGNTSVNVVNPTYVTVTSNSADPTATPSVTVTYTATVASPGGTPTGTVQFYDNLLPIGSPVTLNGSGAATVTINTALVQAASGNPDVLTPGQHAVSAVYTPDAAGMNTYFTSTDDYIQNVQDQPFNAADAFVYRVGDGTTPLNPSAPSTVQGSIGSTIFVDEYTPAGALVQSLALPTADGPTVGVSGASESGSTVTITTGVPHGFSAGQQVVVSGMTPSGYNGTFTIVSVPTSTTFTCTDSTTGLANATAFGTATTSTVHAVVGNGQQSSTGQMSLSGDGQFLFVAGYDTNPLNVATAPGIPTVSGSVTRSVARIKYDGTIQDVAMSASNSGSSFGNFNAVYSPDGNQFYVGGDGGVVYYSSFSPSPGLVTPTKTMTSPTGTTTALESMGGNLAIVGPPGFGNDGPQVYSGFPTTAASVSNLPGFSDSAATAGGQASTFYIDAYFTHLNGTGAPAGVNTFYLSDDGPSFAGGAITKWALNAQGITSATESGTTVTITVPGAPAYVSGQTVAIAGVGVAGYNGTFTITGVSGDTFTYTDGTSGLASSSGGTASQWQVVDHITAGVNNSAISFYYLSGATGGSGNVTLDVTYGNGGNSDTGPGDLYSIADTNGWDAPIGTGGAHSDAVTTVASVATGSNEVFRGVADAPLAAVQSVVVNGGTAPIVSASESGTTVTITTDGADGFSVGQSVSISGVTVGGVINPGGYNGVFTIVSVPTSTTFTYTAASGLAAGTLGTATPAATGSGLLAGAQRSMVDSVIYKFNQAVTLGANAFTFNVHGTFAVSSATESGNTVTITTSAASGFVTGQTVTIAGVGVSGYDGAYTITVTGTTTFTYTDPTSGLANSSGGTAGIGQAPTLSYSSPDGGLTWVVTFSGAGVSGNSIANGAYDILLNPTAVTYNYSGATLAQSNRGTDTLYRLFGDGNGDKRVNLTDFNLFDATYNLRDTANGYNAAFDFNDDGRVNLTDFNAFNADYNSRFTGFTTTI